jgi:hypothetical protein
VLRAVTCGVEELLFVIFVGNIVSEGAVRDGVCNGVLGKVSASVGGGVLLEFVEFSDCLTPSFGYRPGSQFDFGRDGGGYQCWRITVRILRFVAR